MQSMLYFMGFALLLLLVSAGLEAVKGQQVATLESAQAKYAADLDLQKEAYATEITKLNAEIEAGVQIKETALYEVLGALQQIEHGKLQAVVKGVKNPTRSNLIDLLAQYCLQVQKIRRTLGSRQIRRVSRRRRAKISANRNDSRVCIRPAHGRAPD